MENKKVEVIFKGTYEIRESDSKYAYGVPYLDDLTIERVRAIDGKQSIYDLMDCCETIELVSIDFAATEQPD